VIKPRPLRRGRSVEQLLQSRRHNERPTVRWVAVHPDADRFVVCAPHVYDEGTPDFLDVSAYWLLG